MALLYMFNPQKTERLVWPSTHSQKKPYQDWPKDSPGFPFLCSLLETAKTESVLFVCLLKPFSQHSFHGSSHCKASAKGSWGRQQALRLGGTERRSRVTVGSQGVETKHVVSVVLMSSGIAMLKSERGRKNHLTQGWKRGFRWEQEWMWLGWMKVKVRCNRLRMVETTCRSLQEISALGGKKLFLLGCKLRLNL